MGDPSIYVLKVYRDLNSSRALTAFERPLRTTNRIVSAIVLAALIIGFSPVISILRKKKM